MLLRIYSTVHMEIKVSVSNPILAQKITLAEEHPILCNIIAQDITSTLRISNTMQNIIAQDITFRAL